MEIHISNKATIEKGPLPGPSAVICMADSPALSAVIKDEANVIDRLNLFFNDANQQFQIVQPPNIEHANLILQFLKKNKNAPYLVVQCAVGIGRSMAVAAAISKIAGLDNQAILSGGTYNRTLYRLLLKAADIQPEPEPLVSITVRVKYAPDRLLLFLLSMRRQRYDNWEVVAVTDGPNQPAIEMLNQFGDPRVRLLQTPEPRGHWGHPYRQIGLEACRGEFIGMSNDDNYYVPGYLEQMMFAMRNADLVFCTCVHSYKGWDSLRQSGDVGSWIARASLIRQMPWTGIDISADQHYFQALSNWPGTRVVEIDRPLFVHN
jgi:hypothetical protein